MDFGALALVIGAGLLGPALASTRRLTLPLVVGELLAGVIIGESGLRLVDATTPTLEILSQIGFALLMLIVGTHLPLRAPGLRSALRHGVAATVIVFLLAVPVALLLRRVTGVDQVGLLVLLLAASSAAVVMPALTEFGATGRRVVIVTAWVAVADVVTIFAIPFVTAEGDTLEVIVGSLLVVALAGVMYLLIRGAAARGYLERTVELGLERDWGLRLRLSVLALFVLAWVATSFSTSVLLAGFSLGFVLALIGEPDSLARELIGVGEGFFIPIFFVVLGARLDVRDLIGDPENLVLLASLVGGMVLVHVAAALVLRVGWPAGLVASAQLGVPSAIASVGLASGMVTPGQAAAIVTAALASVGIAAAGAARLAPAT